MARRNKVTTIAGLRKIKTVMDKVGRKDQLEIIGIGEVSFKCDERSVGGDLTWKEIEKLLRMRVNELKEKVLEDDVMSYAWLNAEEMIADCLTKEKKSAGGDLTWKKIE